MLPHDVLTVPQAQPELLEKIVWHLDEPIGDPATIPTYLLSREAAKEVKVVLTGEGSDEINGGYQTYLRYQLFLKHRGLLERDQPLPQLSSATCRCFAASWEAFGPFLNAGSEFERFKITDGFDFAEGQIPSSRSSRTMRIPVLHGCDSSIDRRQLPVGRSARTAAAFSSQHLHAR